eukprot:TRINITY_DN12095_c0_g1_i1.p3 TRINITY_DN12095_c0_g1~~TRINITY_DN12095_c0_g1_i1.p3  ORF type:complete len:201 (-),score=78.13 TRINITY_DN12095_c0_g1_i1:100-702(-)
MSSSTFSLSSLVPNSGQWKKHFLDTQFQEIIFLITFSLLATLFCIFTNFKNTYLHDLKSKRKAHPRTETTSLSTKITTFLPLVFAVSLSSLYLFLSPTPILSSYPHIFLLGENFLYANLVGRIVVARVCKFEFSLFYFFYIPLVIGILTSLLGWDQFYVLILFSISNILFYLHFALGIINQFCSFLKINCLDLNYKKIKK